MNVRQTAGPKRRSSERRAMAALQRHRLLRRQVVPARLAAIDQRVAVEFKRAARSGQAEPVGAGRRRPEEAGPDGAMMVGHLGEIEIAMTDIGLAAAAHRRVLIADRGELLRHLAGLELRGRRRPRILIATEQPPLPFGVSPSGGRYWVDGRGSTV